MPELFTIILFAAFWGLIGMMFLRLRDHVRGSAEDRKEIIERLDRIEQRLDERNLAGVRGSDSQS
jgi:hypothetical protein